MTTIGTDPAADSPNQPPTSLDHSEQAPPDDLKPSHERSGLVAGELQHRRMPTEAAVTGLAELTHPIRPPDRRDTVEVVEPAGQALPTSPVTRTERSWMTSGECTERSHRLGHRDGHPPSHTTR